MDVFSHGNTLSHKRAPSHSMQQTVYAERETMISRGDLFSASLDPVVGSEQGGIRGVVAFLSRFNGTNERIKQRHERSTRQNNQ